MLPENLQELIEEATNSIVAEISNELMDDETRDNIMAKIAQIISTGVYEMDEIIERFYKESGDVECHTI